MSYAHDRTGKCHEVLSDRQAWLDPARLAVEDASLTIEQGDFVFGIGSSGAGKSTLLELISPER
ncbi:MAG: ATP-binding cassette domain-containing protein [Oscillospiraceae bacterium]